MRLFMGSKKNKSKRQKNTKDQRNKVTQHHSNANVSRPKKQKHKPVVKYFVSKASMSQTIDEFLGDKGRYYCAGDDPDYQERPG